MTKPLWMISYDVTCPKRLRKIHKYCSKYGWPMQKSLFLFALTRQEREDTCEQLIQLMDRKEDKLLCLPFNTAEGGFHLVPYDPVLLVHSDPRLEGFIY